MVNTKNHVFLLLFSGDASRESGSYSWSIHPLFPWKDRTRIFVFGDFWWIPFFVKTAEGPGSDSWSVHPLFPWKDHISVLVISVHFCSLLKPLRVRVLTVGPSILCFLEKTAFLFWWFLFISVHFCSFLFIVKTAKGPDPTVGPSILCFLEKTAFLFWWFLFISVHC